MAFPIKYATLLQLNPILAALDTVRHVENPVVRRGKVVSEKMEELFVQLYLEHVQRPVQEFVAI